MFDQILSSVKDMALGAVNDNQQIPNNKMDDILKIAEKVFKKQVANESSKSGAGNIVNLFSNVQNNSAANSIQNNITDGVVEELVKNIGLDSASAKLAADTVVPMLMKKITDKNSQTPDNDLSPLNDIFGKIGGGSKGGILGGISDLLG